VPDTLYRRCSMSVHQLVQSFGLETASDFVRTCYANGRYDEQVPVIHAIEPNDDRAMGVKTARGKPWRSVYWDDNDGRADRVLRVSGYEEQPFWAPRWDTTGGDTYGTAPGFDALPDMRELQLQTRRKTNATKFLVEPEKIVPATVVEEIRRGGDRKAFVSGGYATLPGWSYHNYWWVSHDDHGVYMARGIHGQAIYVDPKAEMVIARFASHPLAGNVNLDPLSLPAYRAVAEYLMKEKR